MGKLFNETPQKATYGNGTDEYLSRVERQAECALIQVAAVMRCDRHKDVLLFLNADFEVERGAYNFASIWLGQEGTKFMREDLQDAIKSVLGRAAREGCPECAR
jgi:hypothetical protein